MIRFLRRLFGITEVLDNQRTIMSKLDDIISAINTETNALAAKIDALEIAAGGTVTQANLDALSAISARLKGLAAPDDAPPVAVAPAPTPAPVPESPVAG